MYPNQAPPFVFNRNWKIRDAMLDLDAMGYMGGTRHYAGMTVETLGKMLEMKFADPEEQQNDCPTIQEIYDFMKEYPMFTAHGYVVTIDRDDYRLSIEGVAGNTEDLDAMLSFTHMFRWADEFEVAVGYQYCWFD